MRKTYQTLILLASLLLPLLGQAQQDTYPNPKISQLLAQAQTANAVDASRILQALQAYPKSAYSQDNKEQLEELLYLQPRQMDDWLKLAGFLQMRTELQRLPDTLYDSRSNKQAYRLALVRAGDPNKLTNLMRNVPKIPINDNFVYQVAPLLLYTRQREAIDYIMDIVLSSPETCKPADAETPGRISCAYRLMEMLAPVIVEYPFTVGISGDLEVTDYQGALQELQDWILRNRDDYTINEENY